MTAAAVDHAPAVLWVPEWDFTDGDLVADWSSSALGIELDPEQRLIADAQYAGRRDEPGPACFETVAVAPRQNLKTLEHEVAALADLFLFEDMLNVWTAHLFPTARKSFEHMVGLIDSRDDLRRRCRKPRTANGQEAIQLLSGPKLEFHARSKGGGRGFTDVGKVTLDEALFLGSAEQGALLPTMATNPYAQVRYLSSAGMATSTAAHKLHARGVLGGQRRLFYAEWSAPRVPCAEFNCSHEAGRVEGCALDDESLWALANPALGRRISLETLRGFRDAMPPGEFAREFLGWWDDPAAVAPAFGEGRWQACRVEADSPPKVVAVGLAVSHDRAWASIGAAGLLPDGRVFVSPSMTVDGKSDRRRGTAWLAARAAEIQRRHDCAVVFDAKGPAWSLEAELIDAEVRSTPLTSDEVAEACATVFDLVAERKLAHPGDAELDEAAEVAVARPMGDRWVWGRRISAGDVSMLEAVTLAAWAAARPEIPQDFFGAWR